MLTINKKTQIDFRVISNLVAFFSIQFFFISFSYSQTDAIPQFEIDKSEIEYTSHPSNINVVNDSTVAYTTYRNNDMLIYGNDVIDLVISDPEKKSLPIQQFIGFRNSYNDYGSTVGSLTYDDKENRYVYLVSDYDGFSGDHESEYVKIFDPVNFTQKVLFINATPGFTAVNPTFIRRSSVRVSIVSVNDGIGQFLLTPIYEFRNPQSSGNKKPDYYTVSISYPTESILSSKKMKLHLEDGDFTENSLHARLLFLLKVDLSNGNIISLNKVATEIGIYNRNQPTADKDNLYRFTDLANLVVLNNDEDYQTTNLFQFEGLHSIVPRPQSVFSVVFSDSCSINGRNVLNGTKENIGLLKVLLDQNTCDVIDKIDRDFQGVKYCQFFPDEEGGYLVTGFSSMTSGETNFSNGSHIIKYDSEFNRQGEYVVSGSSAITHSNLNLVNGRLVFLGDYNTPDDIKVYVISGDHNPKISLINSKRKDVNRIYPIFTSLSAENNKLRLASDQSPFDLRDRISLDISLSPSFDTLEWSGRITLINKDGGLIDLIEFYKYHFKYYTVDEEIDFCIPDTTYYLKFTVDQYQGEQVISYSSIRRNKRISSPTYKFVTNDFQLVMSDTVACCVGSQSYMSNTLSNEPIFLKREHKLTKELDTLSGQYSQFTVAGTDKSFRTPNYLSRQFAVDAQGNINDYTYWLVEKGCKDYEYGDAIDKLASDSISFYAHNYTQEIVCDEDSSGFRTVSSYDIDTTSNTFLDTINFTHQIYKPDFHKITSVVCQGETVFGHSESGIYIDTLTSRRGCDSIVHIDLTVYEPSYSNITTEICSGDDYNGHTVSGNYIDTLDQCRIVNLNLTVRQDSIYSHRVNEIRCRSTEATTTKLKKTDYYTSQAGCDSTVQLFTVFKPSQNVVSVLDLICSSGPREDDGVQVPALTYGDGCENELIKDIHAIFMDTLISIEKKVIYKNESYLDYDSTGMYEISRSNSKAGCDSIHYLDLIVLDQLNLDPSDSVILDPSDSILLEISNEEKFNLTLYPNPSKGIVTFHNPYELINTKVVVYSLQGALMFEDTIDEANRLSYSMNLSHLPKGQYIMVMSGDKVAHLKLLLE